MNQTPPRDPALPHLATALDSNAMARVFERMLKRPVERCRIDRIKYRPQRNASVSYVVELRDNDGRVFEQPVATRWCQGNDSERRHAQALQRTAVASAAGPTWSHRPELDLFAAWAPNDPKLAALAELLDAQRLRSRWLPEVAATLGCAHVRSHATTLVRWVPEHRACARVDLRLDDGRAVTVYAKADTEAPAANAHAVLQALRANPRLRTPRPLACQPTAGLYWQEAIDGLPLASLGRGFGLPHAAQVGEMMAALHATSVPIASEIRVEGMRRQRRDAAHALATVEPSWRPTLGRLTAALDRCDAAMSALAPCTLHGDLHRGNLLATDAGVVLIDLDGVRRGPAALELGSWIADSIYLALLDGLAPESAAPQWRELLRAYACAGGSEVDEAQLAWATAQQLLCQRAYRCVANLKPGRMAIVPALLRQAESLASAGTLDSMAWEQAA